MRASFQPVSFTMVLEGLKLAVDEGDGIMVLTAVHQVKDEALTSVSHCQIMRAMSRALDIVGSYCDCMIGGPVQPHSLWMPGADLKEEISVMWTGGASGAPVEEEEEKFLMSWA